MKKTIFLMIIFACSLISSPIFAACVDAPDMAVNADGDPARRCENKEAVCYVFSGSASCFKK